jgi:hypothetical protein
MGYIWIFLAIDSELNLPPGTFYKMIGMAFGVDSSYAVYVGFLLHMITRKSNIL